MSLIASEGRCPLMPQGGTPYTLEVCKGIDLMKLFIGGLIGLVLSVSVGAEPLLRQSTFLLLLRCRSR